MSKWLSLSLNRKFTGLSVWLILFLCFDAVFWVLLLLRPVSHARLIMFDDLLQVLGPLLAVLLCLKRFQERRTNTSLFLGLGILAYVVGQSIWSYYELIAQQPPFPSFADLAFLASYPLLFLGVLLLPARQLLNVSRARMIVDSLMIMTAIVTFSWFFVLGPTLLLSSQSLLAKAVGTAYPCCDILLLLCVLLLWVRQEERGIRPELLSLTLGLIAIVLVDSIFDYLSMHNGYATGSLIDPLWSLGYQAIGVAVFILPRKSTPTSSTSRPSLRPLGLSLLPYAFVPALGLLLLYTWWTPENNVLRPGVYIGAAVLIGLVMVRQIIAMREIHALYANNDALAVANKQLEVQATHDTLTGLPNRSLLQMRLEQATRQARKGSVPIALLLLDLDRFKDVNDALGHEVGDLLLQEIGPRLQEHLRSTDLCARLGGDEFAIVLPATDEAQAIQIAHRLLSALIKPFLIDNHGFEIGGSIGIAFTPQQGFDFTTLLRYADIAMYVAKRNQSGYAVYTHEIDHNSPRKLTLVSELRQAIADGGLLMHYQPKILLSSGQMMGVEALVRWLHPVHGLIQPDEFIPLAERTGLIGPLTYWVLDRSIRQCRDWERSGLHIKMAVNLSTRSLYDEELIPTVKGLLELYQVSPSQLTLEITESTLMEDPERAYQVLASLRTLGVSISLDDFGTGYSSLAYLKRLPLDEIKLDKTFVLGLSGDADPTDVAIVQAVIAMARPLNCKVVAEGVENLESWKLLQKFGCDLAQGYHFSRPLPAGALEQWARTTGWVGQLQDIVAAA
jgi:diguanylate cyclase (GGDEF)-like protein